MNEVCWFLIGIVSGGEDFDLFCLVFLEFFVNVIEYGLLEFDFLLKEILDGFFEFY